ncbi:MAG TPA: glycosyltransferase, partial [Puia sp.]|nr:glycosyltransferase [Puia sp.]
MNGHTAIHFLIATAGILLLIYALLIFYYHRTWDRIPSPTQPLQDTLNIKVSVIIPARNEALRIGKCLDSLLAQSYPKEFTEIVVVNDFSTDNTVILVAEHALPAKLINLSDHISGFINSYKKKAIETGIAHSSGELIICTDADCSMGKDWIRVLVNAYKKEDLQFIAAPVKIISNRTWLSVFQTLDFISLQGITGAAVYKNLYPMCNGANLAYTRKAYNAVGGFWEINHIASGDDMLLMKKIQS